MATLGQPAVEPSRRDVHQTFIAVRAAALCSLTCTADGDYCSGRPSPTNQDGTDDARDTESGILRRVGPAFHGRHSRARRQCLLQGLVRGSQWPSWSATWSPMTSTTMIVLTTQSESHGDIDYSLHRYPGEAFTFTMQPDGYATITTPSGQPTTLCPRGAGFRNTQGLRRLGSASGGPPCRSAQTIKSTRPKQN